MTDKKELLIDTEPESNRDFRRYAVELSVQVRPAIQAGMNPSAHALRNPFRQGVVKDLSVKGLYFISPMRFAVGDIVDIELVCAGRTFQLQAIVRRSIVDHVSARATYGTGTQLIRSPQTAIAIPAIASYLKGRTIDDGSC